MSEHPARPAPTVACPACGRKIIYDTSSPFRPFCSERCRVMDFTDWANERYRIADRGNNQPEPDDGDA